MVRLPRTPVVPFRSFCYAKRMPTTLRKMETYNSRLKERYEDDLSTHPNFDPDLWLEGGSPGRPDRNWEYGFSNTRVENLQTTCSISIIRSSQSLPSTQSSEFAALLDRVQERTAHLNEKYEQPSADYEELRQMIMDIRSQLGGTYAPSY